MTKTRMTSNPELRDLIKLGEQQGWIIDTTSGGHLKWIPPDPNMEFVITSSTPSDNAFAIKKIRNDLEKRGLITNRDELKRKQRGAVTGDVSDQDRVVAAMALRATGLNDGVLEFMPEKMQGIVLDLVAQGIGTVDQMGPCEGCNREFPNSLGAVAHRRKCDPYQRYITEQAAAEAADIPIATPVIEPEPDTHKEIPMAATATLPPVAMPTDPPSPPLVPESSARLTRAEMREVLDYLDVIESNGNNISVQLLIMVINDKNISIVRGESELEVVM